MPARTLSLRRAVYTHIFVPPLLAPLYTRNIRLQACQQGVDELRHSLQRRVRLTALVRSEKGHGAPLRGPRAGVPAATPRPSRLRRARRGARPRRYTSRSRAPAPPRRCSAYRAIRSPAPAADARTGRTFGPGRARGRCSLRIFGAPRRLWKGRRRHCTAHAPAECRFPPVRAPASGATGDRARIRRAQRRRNKRAALKIFAG